MPGKLAKACSNWPNLMLRDRLLAAVGCSS